MASKKRKKEVAGLEKDEDHVNQGREKRLRSSNSTSMASDAIEKILLDAVNRLTRIDKDGTFADPVENVVPGYNAIIKRPMDLSTLRENVKSHVYTTPSGKARKEVNLNKFFADVDIIFKNFGEFNSFCNFFNDFLINCCKCSQRFGLNQSQTFSHFGNSSTFSKRSTNAS